MHRKMCKMFILLKKYIQLWYNLTGIINREERQIIMNNTKEIIDINMKGAVNKANLSLGKMILLGIVAGMFIAIGGATSNTAVHSISDVGLTRTLAGAIFPVGLMMIVFVGGELFTGNCLMIMAVLDGKISISKMVRNLVVVFLSNLIGALAIVIILYYSGNMDYTGGALGAYTIKVALGKASITPLKAITSGILCNILVCIAILMAAAAKDAAGKILAIWFPIFAFVIGGFEHVVANMYYIPAGMIASCNPDYVAKAEELYGIGGSELAKISLSGLVANFSFVAIGNIIGGMVVVGVLLWSIYKINE